MIDGLKGRDASRVNTVHVYNTYSIYPIHLLTMSGSPCPGPIPSPTPASYIQYP
jgi:hypothetical protein